MTSRLTKKQGITILAIVAAGIVLAALILARPGATAEGEAEHGHAGQAHDKQEHDQKGHGKEEDGKQEHGKEQQHAHDEAPEKGHDDHDDEGKLALSAAQIKAAGLTMLAAGPGRIEASVTLPGEIRFNEDRTAHVVPRLGGVVESVHADLGQLVQKGQVLAVIASTALSEMRSELLSAQRRLELARSTDEREQRLWREKISAEQDALQARQALREAEIAVRNASDKLRAIGAGAAGVTTSGALNRYEIRAPFQGIVMEKHVALGEAVKDDANIFLISDLSSVWAEIAVPASELNTVTTGTRATVKAGAFDASASGVITYVGALIGEQSRTAKARVTLANPAMVWRPGLQVSVDVAAKGASAEVAVSVDAQALHQVEQRPVVFVETDGGFIAQPVRTGRADGKRVEILDGIKPGQRYAGAGSFILKSELGKASASHEH